MTDGRAKAITNDMLAQQMPLRHSVRSYTDDAIEGEVHDSLEQFIALCNEESGLQLQLLTNEAAAFSGLMAKYGKFENVRNYIACVGPKGKSLQENVGYWGERCVLAAQSLGLNSCWVAQTFSKSKMKAQIAPGQKTVCVISLGYGTTEGRPRKSKSAADVSAAPESAPEWFKRGIEAALLAPTAMNQQKFMVEYHNDGGVSAKSTGGFYSSIDLGIVKAHFELGSGKGRDIWRA